MYKVWAGKELIRNNLDTKVETTLSNIMSKKIKIGEKILLSSLKYIYKVHKYI